MKCYGDRCPEGLRTCCRDCYRYQVGLCKEGLCPDVEQVGCPDYEATVKLEEKKENRKLTIWAAILLIAVMTILGIAIHQSYKNAEYIAEIESGLSDAADQSASAYSTITNYSISDFEVMSNGGQVKHYLMDYKGEPYVKIKNN